MALHPVGCRPAHTIVRSKQASSTTTTLAMDAELTPSMGSSLKSNDFTILPQSDDVYQRMLELEQELIEFQESSKELEQTLEEELHELESQNSLLLSQVQLKDSKILELSQTVVRLNQELAGIAAQHTARDEETKKIIAELKKNLVTMEILNDDMVSRDRIFEQKLLLANQFNNELLERIAMTENDLETEREINARHQLTISNMENTLPLSLRITRSKRDSTYQDFSTADGTILDINEMLASEPPQPVRAVPRSDSLHKLHQLHNMSDVLLHKVGEMNTSLSLKSPSTTEVSKHRHPSHSGTTKMAINYSPSIKNLSRIQLAALPAEDTTNTVLVPPAKPRARSSTVAGKEAPAVEAKKKTRIKSVMKSFFT